MRQYIVDAFTDKIFCGNQAAIIILNEWIEEDLMMNITKENNLSETAFAVKEVEEYHLRWFTPGGEIDLCGHATLGCAYVLMNFYEKEASEIIFTTLSGRLVVKREEDMYQMQFPAYDLKELPLTDDIVQALGKTPSKVFFGRDMLCVFDNEEDVLALKPDKDKVEKLEGLLLHVTAPAKNSDCVSRSFAPKLNVWEDPVCGSGHCHIAPYWSNTLQKEDIHAYQASQRGGTLFCKSVGNKVYLSGKAVLFAISELQV